MAKATYVSRGEAINYVNNTENDIFAGDIVSLATRIGVAGSNIPNGSEGAVRVEGVFEMPKGNTAVSPGTAVYYSVSDGVVTTEASTGSESSKVDNIPVGYAIFAASAADKTVLVKLLG